MIREHESNGATTRRILCHEDSRKICKTYALMPSWLKKFLLVIPTHQGMLDYCALELQ